MSGVQGSIIVNNHLRNIASNNAAETVSVATSRSRQSEISKRSQLLFRKGLKNSAKAHSIIRHVILKGVSSQLVSARHRVDAGLPTSMAAAGSYIAVGTSHGFVLVFDGLQTLRYSLGTSDGGGIPPYGSASCLCFNQDPQDLLPTRLLVGYAKGQLVEYDITSGKILRQLSDAHPLGSSIIHVKFTDDPTVALLCDSGGSVFEVNFTRTMGVRGFNSRCIFSGSRGEVCAMEPLMFSRHHPSHRLMNRNIIALATISKVIVLNLKPAMRVIFTQSLVGRKDTLPLLGWQFVIIQVSRDSKVVDPVLSFARESTIYFYQLSENLSGKIIFVPLQTIQVPFTLLNMGWLNTRSLGILDSTETFHLYDVRSQETLESLDLSKDVNLVYGSSFFKGLATGGNVSAAMAAAAERATFGSFLTFTNQVLLLGRDTFHVLVLRNWHERLDYLVKTDRYVEALNLGAECYQDQGKLCIGLKGPKETRRRVVTKKMMEILGNYLKVSMNQGFPQEGNVQILREYFEKVIPPCINLCMVLKRKDYLFQTVWETFCVDPFAKAKFLDSLERLILSDQLRNLPVSVCQELVNLFEQNPDRLVALEACITHLNVTSLDIHQVMSVCRKHSLYDAIIYIHNNALSDYVTPIEELLSIIEPSAREPTDKAVNLGNKLLVYISCCLAGRAYPYGDIDNKQVAQVKYDVYTCLTSLKGRKPAVEGHVSYPYLRSLLNFDTQGFLNVISIAFEEPEFNTELGLCQKQRLVDILLQIMVKASSKDFSPSQVAHLFTFLARQMARDGGSAVFQISADLFDQVLDILTDNSPEALSSSLQEREEWQQALLDLLNSGYEFNRDSIMERAKRANFYRILEVMHENAGDHDKVLSCYIDDPQRRMQAFSYVQKVFIEADFDVAEASEGERIHL